MHETMLEVEIPQEAPILAMRIEDFLHNYFLYIYLFIYYLLWNRT
jgi:hypothetical protein